MNATIPKLILSTMASLVLAVLPTSGGTILGWNNLGMHCMDSDYSVFSVLPPYNTIECQLIVNGRLVTNGVGYSVTYEAVADPNGSFNSTAMGKGNYYMYATALFGASLTPEGGLAGWSMPGTNNTPQGMLFETTNHPAAGVATSVNWFRAEGIPISPYDDAHNKNPYPMMRLIARNAVNQPIATNDIVLPVSDEMDCRTCHASGTQVEAKPAAGWVWNGLPERDFRLNILRLHDEKNFSQHAALYSAALAARGFNPQGLYRGVVADKKPVLCAICHASEALGTGSYSNIPPLTASVHAFHANVPDPELFITLDNSANRAACYRCHPGSTARCLRGAMGGAIAPDGSMAMQCQSCHGNMSAVGSSSRVGWFMEPNCQSCHSGTATANAGQIRFTSGFDTNGNARVPANQTFATQPNTPTTGLSLYRFSAGHGGLQCSACHGSTHAEFPSTHSNDNVRNTALQGHAGVMIECTACHTTTPNTANGGPHGMHPVGQGWVNGSGGVTKHSDWISSLPGGVAACQICHGLDFRGTVLSRAQATRTLTSNFDGGTVSLNLYRGAMIGCYTCHNGPANDSINNSTAPTVSNISTNATNDKAVAMTLPTSGSSSALRIVSQPANGSVGLSNGVATYFPNQSFVGTDTFTFAAYNGSKNSNLGTGTVAVAQGAFSISAVAHVPPSYPSGWPAAFAIVPTLVNSSAAVSFLWDFGDGTVAATNQFTQHAYAVPGIYPWKVISTISTVRTTNSGEISIENPISVAATLSGSSISLQWPNALCDVVLEQTDALGTHANWTPVTNLANVNLDVVTTLVPASSNKFFRVRRPW